uniref:UDP-glucosyltransferase UGT79A10 n=1 Tax=Polygala tenuifolia TaxID=355332 RepID=A0A3G3NBJ4_9FABA|nr:UDP-glucosyltransferase UGT79A10 [Polygala tenuifolia]
MGRDNSDELHIAVFPYFAFGHIGPFVQLSNRLAAQGVRISFFSARGNIPRTNSFLISTPTTQIIPLDIPPVDGIPADISSTSELSVSMMGLFIHSLDLMQSQVKSLLAELKPDFILLDFAQHWLPKLASELGIRSLHFAVFSAISNAYIAVPSRQSAVKGSITFEDLKKPPPGYPSQLCLRTFEAKDFMFMFQRFGEGINGYERVTTTMSECSAIIFKSCKEFEGPFLDYFERQYRKPVLLSGPLVPAAPSGVLEEKWADWLAQFSTKSVIFCSFGSETFLNDEQIKELALGLELTGLPFILVLNFPTTVQAEVELERALPKGFMERVKDRGMVHTGWVQQQLILAHPNVGCYVNHSGFSSILEALVHECQLVLLPFKGDQFFNSKLVAEELEVGVEVNRRDEDGYFSKDDIHKAVSAVMSGIEEEAGKKVRENQLRWRNFLLDEEIWNKYIVDLVAKLKEMAFLV